VAGVDRGEEGNGGKKREGMRDGLSLVPFALLSRSPPLFLHLPRRVYGDVLSIQAMKKCNIVIEIFGIGHFHEQSF